MEMSRWTEGEAQGWYGRMPWLRGYNFVPTTASNTTEMWQADTFDEETIERELDIASSLGFNTCRVFVQYLVWASDPEGLKERIGRFLAIADKHGQSVVPVLFDDCSFGDPPITEPYLGKQREPIPGMILPSWTPSPGLSRVVDYEDWPRLEEYVRDVVSRFGHDDRVVFWDLYNEPGNSGMGEKSLPLAVVCFEWARKASPRQPLTIGAWDGVSEEMNRALVALSDVVSFHAYVELEGLRRRVAELEVTGRPLVCTEWFARLKGGNVKTDLPFLKSANVGCYMWGLINGRTQAHHSWESPKGSPEPTEWFHDLFHGDGTPYRSEEIEAVKTVNASG